MLTKAELQKYVNLPNTQIAQFQFFLVTQEDLKKIKNIFNINAIMYGFLKQICEKYIEEI